jgi:carboxyl-terminal processing protease
MKSFAEALDSQTAFFTPTEAKQLLIGMQQRLFGIGVLLRDDVDGFSVVKIVEGGPAEQQGNLALGDKIIAVDNDPVIGLDMLDVVEMIRGEPGSSVSLKVIRKNSASESSTMHIVIHRGEVVVKDLRYGSKIKPIKDGVIAYLRLHSFYQDAENSSYSDLLSSITELKKQHDVKGVILDLRCNPGGLLTQAVAVSGIFLDKGVVVSIHDEEGSLIHMRNLSSKKAWDGPLIVLINRGSASAAEIVAQVLQDWGRAVIVGDDRSFGKGSFQIFTLCPDGITPPSSQGEYKVTRGRYYTVSGKSPQLVGVRSDIVVPGTLCFTEIGEQYLKFPLSSDNISANFSDSIEDLPFFQRSLIRRIYATDEQKQTNQWTVHIPELKKRTEARMNMNEPFLQFIGQLKNHVIDFDENQKEIDYQLDEAWNIIEDLSTLSEEQNVNMKPAEAA